MAVSTAGLVGIVLLLMAPFVVTVLMRRRRLRASASGWGSGSVGRLRPQPPVTAMAAVVQAGGVEAAAEAGERGEGEGKAASRRRSKLGSAQESTFLAPAPPALAHFDGEPAAACHLAAEAVAVAPGELGGQESRCTGVGGSVHGAAGTAHGILP